jgi:outer membrane protein assembly factor BamB
MQTSTWAWHPDRRFRLALVAPATFLLCILGILSPARTGTAWGQDWSQWRGPERDGLAAGIDLPETWPDALERLWQVEVGEGYSSPIVSGDRAFVFTREGGEEVLRAMSLEDGSIHWRASYAAPYRVNRAASSHGSGPKSTPVVADGRICTLGISGVLSCFDAGSGDLLWQNDYSDEFPSTSPLYGAAMSPAVIDGSLIVHVGGGRGGALMALDPGSGSVRWRWDGDGPGYASPVAVEIGGQRQIVTQSARQIIGVSPDDGGLLWQIPFRTPFDQNVVTPLVVNESLILSGLQQSTFAVEVVDEGVSLSTREVWRNDRLPMYMSSPVFVAGRVFGFSNMRRGQFFCLDPATGKSIWTSEGRQGDNAALVVVDGLLLALTNGAELFVIDPAASEFAPIARYTVAESATYAHPVPRGGGLLIKDSSTLALLRW